MLYNKSSYMTEYSINTALIFLVELLVFWFLKWHHTLKGLSCLSVFQTFTGNYVSVLDQTFIETQPNPCDKFPLQLRCVFVHRIRVNPEALLVNTSQIWNGHYADSSQLKCHWSAGLWEMSTILFAALLSP